MRFYTLANGYFTEVKNDNIEVKDIKKNLWYPGKDLNGEDIKFIDVERKSLKPVVTRVWELRFANIYMRNSKIIMLLLLIWCVFFGSQYSNYYWQTKNLTLANEQLKKENDLLRSAPPVVHTGSTDNTKKTSLEEIQKESFTANVNTGTTLTKEQQAEFERAQYQKTLDMLTLENEKSNLQKQNSIDLLTTQLTQCNAEKTEAITQKNSQKNEMQIYNEIEAKYKGEKMQELENIVKYKYLDEARALAQKSCTCNK